MRILARLSLVGSSFVLFGCGASPPSAPSSFPDLQVADVTAPTEIVAGRSFTTSVQFRNAGNAVAPSGWILRGYVSPDPTIDAADVVIGEMLEQEALPAGSQVARDLATSVPLAFGDGPAYVGVILDATGATNDGNRTNNAKATAGRAQVYVRADLEVGPFTWSQNTFNQVTISGNLYNRGNVAVTSFQYRFYLSRDTVFGVGAVPVGDAAVGEEWVGAAWARMSAPLFISCAMRAQLIPQGVSGTDVWGFVDADPENQIVEISKGNNLRRSSGSQFLPRC